MASNREMGAGGGFSIGQGGRPGPPCRWGLASQESGQPLRDRLVGDIAVKSLEELAPIVIPFEKRATLAIDRRLEIVERSGKLGHLKRGLVHKTATPGGRRWPE